MRRLRRSGTEPKPGWAHHWDPHPLCWLENVLAANPYRHGGLGMRARPTGDVAVTLPGMHVVLIANPADQHHVTWRVETHDARNPSHEPREFGRFVWARLNPAVLDRTAGVFRLAGGTALVVAEPRGPTATRYRIESLAEPGRLIPGSERWADLGAIERIARRIHTELLAPGAAPA